MGPRTYAFVVAIAAVLIGAGGALAAGFSSSSANPANAFEASERFCPLSPEEVMIANRDSYIDSLSAFSNFGSSTELRAGPARILVIAERRILVGFALPAIPERCTLTSATLRLYATNPNSGRSIQALRLNGGWTEGGVNWSNAPSFTGGAATSSSLSSPGWQSWSVLSHIQAMYSSGNHGFMVKDSQNSALLTAHQVYQSREGTPTSQRPQLRLTFE